MTPVPVGRSGRGARRDRAGAARQRPGVRLPEGTWVLLPQAVARLSAVYVFAVAASQVTAEQLGVLSIATAATAAAFGLAPAVVGKPLAVLPVGPQLAERARSAQSFAVAAALGTGLALALAAPLASGMARLTLSACAVGVPAAMVVETQYWRTVFLRGRRHAGLVLAGAYVLQSAAVTVAAVALPAPAVVLSPFCGLAAAAVATLAVGRGLSWSGARAWAGPLRPTWLPYVYGVTAAVVLVQAIPLVLATAAGLTAASVYRAGELVFGGTNLLIGVITQTLLTQDTADVRRAYRRATSALVAVALLNGLVVAALPVSVLTAVVGPVAVALRDLLPMFTVQRAALGVAYVGSVLLIRVLAARVVGAFGVGSAVLNLALLLVGAAWGGVTGGVAGLATAEALVALAYLRLVRRST